MFLGAGGKSRNLGKRLANGGKEGEYRKEGKKSERGEKTTHSHAVEGEGGRGHPLIHLRRVRREWERTKTSFFPRELSAFLDGVDICGYEVA